MLMSYLSRAPKRMRLLILAISVIFPACASVPQVAQTCPKFPPVPQVVDLSEDFQSEIANWLGLDTDPTSYAITPVNARLGSKR